MEIEDSSGQVSIGFPLGLALLVTLLLFICCFFCCCLHWNKLQSLFSSSGVINSQAQIQVNFTSSPQKPGFPVLMMKQNQARSLPVLMPGDKVPRFIALECPCQPPTEDRITIHVSKAAPSDFII
ncbi:uncharacterized protein At5g65660-like [Gastrolobium bilobum]|uniref:uncharacterized protein At5g65660-like n=1 Tax=Gastrolobium bilobum TaxID=150636 RepID=UPI002AB054AF|nr:uncharacterized protein At5g65660-like [Gastrolobium bilobum]